MASKDYASSFYFELSFKGEDASFQEVSGIGKELGVEEVVCGGENRFKYRLPTVASSHNLVLKRALLPEGSALIDWCSRSIDGGLAKPIMPQDVSVSLLDETGTVYVKWTFHKAYPVKYAASDLKSQENGIVIESIELAYTYFTITSASYTGNLYN
jgi:phage tail-like protein